MLARRLRLSSALKIKRSFVTYVQGQSPTTKTREYFYYIDHQGQLFLDDAKVKNFITCFKDKKFLAFFFKRLKPNNTNCYQQDFPYVSPCGPETNYVRCDDLPIVFTQLLNDDKKVIQDISEYSNASTDSPKETWLSYSGTSDLLVYPFQPQKLYMSKSGRIYHEGPKKLGGVGLIKSSLAIELSSFFTYSSQEHNTVTTSHSTTNAINGAGSNPIGFIWQGINFELDNIKKCMEQR